MKMQLGLKQKLSKIIMIYLWMKNILILNDGNDLNHRRKEIFYLKFSQKIVLPSLLQELKNI